MNQRSLALWSLAIVLIKWAREYVLQRVNRPVGGYSEPEDCWEWNKGGDGRYGHAYIFGERIKAHVLAYLAWGGYLARHHIVSHGCDNPPCCRPSHLNGETQSKNIARCYAKGRSNLSRKKP